MRCVHALLYIYDEDIYSHICTKVKTKTCHFTCFHPSCYAGYECELYPTIPSATIAPPSGGNPVADSRDSFRDLTENNVYLWFITEHCNIMQNVTRYNHIIYVFLLISCENNVPQHLKIMTIFLQFQQYKLGY